MKSLRVVVALVAALLLLASCGESVEPNATGPAASPEPVAEVEESPEPEPTPEPTKTKPPKPPKKWRLVGLGKHEPPEFPGGALVARSTSGSLTTYEEPASWKRSKGSYATTNPLDQELSFLIVKAARTDAGTLWYKVLVPERPNGLRGWVPEDAVAVETVTDRIVVDLSDYNLKYFDNGELLHEFTVGVGEDVWPTPVGLFYVWAHVPQPDPAGPYGRYALGISGFSPVLSDWPGGGRAALHGTANPGDRGLKVSHGCVRIYNDDLKKIEGVPMGTPVLIRA